MGVAVDGGAPGEAELGLDDRWTAPLEEGFVNGVAVGMLADAAATLVMGDVDRMARGPGAATPAGWPGWLLSRGGWRGFGRGLRSGGRSFRVGGRLYVVCGQPLLGALKGGSFGSKLADSVLHWFLLPFNLSPSARGGGSVSCGAPGSSAKTGNGSMGREFAKGDERT